MRKSPPRVVLALLLLFLILLRAVKQFLPNNNAKKPILHVSLRDSVIDNSYVVIVMPVKFSIIQFVNVYFLIFVKNAGMWRVR